jgi:hypothetical protein
MTTAFDKGIVPQWNTDDRMEKAMRVAGLSVAEMSDYFDTDLRAAMDAAQKGMA